MKLKGSVTVFLSLMLSAFLVLLQSLTYGLTIQNGKNYRKADTLRAVECVFAEYRKELWETYGIFAIDGSYEKETVTSIKSVEENIEDRISFYDEGMLAHQLSDILLLTDNSGQSLHTQILKTMEKKYGMEVLKDAEKKEQILQKTEEEKGNVAEELNGIKEQFEHLENQEIEDGENPLKQLASVFSGSLLGMVFPKDKSLSAKNVEIKTLPSGRKNIQGHGTFEPVSYTHLTLPTT